MKYSRTRLNAMAYERTRRNQVKAVKELLNHYGIDFTEYQWFTEYKGSPCRLCSDIHKYAPATERNIRMYALYLREKTEKEVIRESCSHKES